MKHVIRLSLFTAIGVGGLGGIGCAPSPLDENFWVARRPLGEGLETFQPPNDPGPSPAATGDRLSSEPEGDLLLRDALAAALLRSPGLAGFAYEIRAAEARTLQAGLRPNPELELEFENFAGSGVASGTDALETTLALRQTFPLGDDIERRRQVARLRGTLAGWDYEAARMAVLTEVSRRFIALLAAQRQVELAQESVGLASQVLDSISRRIEAGDAPDIERSRATLPTVTAGIELRRAERAVEAARQRLAVSWGGSTPLFSKAVGDLTRVAPVPPASALVALVNQNPGVARWAVEITARQAEVKLIEAEATPDITGFVGYRRFNESDDNAVVAGISIPLSVFDRRQGDLLAARIGVASAHVDRRAAELRVKDAIATAYSQLAGAFSEVTTLRDEAIPPATEAYAAIRNAFSQGNLGYLDMLDAERVLINLKQKYLDALVTYHGAVTEIEGLIGQRLDSLDADPAGVNQNKTRTVQNPLELPKEPNP